MKTPSPFTNPYAKLPESELTRLQTYVATADHNFVFHTLHPGGSSVRTTVNILFTKFIAALRAHNIVDHSTDRLRFEQFLLNSIIVLPTEPGLSGSPSSGNDAKTSPPLKRSRITGVRAKTTSPKGKSSELQSNG